ncbi:MAG: hypothetical protein M1827_002337 [Pycnora praestabilis]|nr:MAG: hypothetical protein M1827_002337 [Pycnora praestabilis]
MAMWPFGRKNRRSSRIEEEKGTAMAKGKSPAGTQIDTGKEILGNSTKVSAAGTEQNSNRKQSERQRRRLSKPAHSFHDKDSFYAMPYPSEKSPAPPLPKSRAPRNLVSELPADVEKPRPRTPPPEREDVPSYYFQQANSYVSLPPERRTELQRPPTLRAKRSANDSGLMRRKSSKKKKQENRYREQEIKSMSVPIPVPSLPAGYRSGSPRRDSKKIHGGLNRHPERPMSDLSLHFSPSVHSSASEISDQHAFKISALDVLSPRPTIRYSENPRHAGASSTWVPSRSNSKRSKRLTIPENSVNQRRRVDELADTLDAGGLRELMERDQRRQEKKRRSDNERLQRRLERKAEKQRLEEESDRQVNLPEFGERGRVGRDPVGLGIGGNPVAEPIQRMSGDSERKREPHSPMSWLKDPSRERLPTNPFIDRDTETEIPPIEESSPTDEHEEPVIGTAQAVRLSQASMSPPSSPTHHNRGISNLSYITDLRPDSVLEVPAPLESDRRDSDTSTRQAGNWASFFRRSGTKQKWDSADRGRSTPSEFSNTSRESMSRQPPPVSLQRTYRRSGTPVRTQSKFREELPGLPISPPDSRVQSPEAVVAGQPTNSERPRSGLAQRISGAASSTDPFADLISRVRNETPTSRRQSMDVPSPDVPSAALSQSLASVDSEGSWLSGRPAKRSSQPQVHPLRNSASSLQKRYQGFSASDEELGVAGDEYFNRLTPGPDQMHGDPYGTVRKPSSTAIASLDDSDDEVGNASEQPEPEKGMWHTAVARQATVVHTAPRVKSREGLLHDFPAEHESVLSSPDETPEGEGADFDLSGPTAPWIHRATSVDLGMQHVRQVSAGSAKLLDLPARAPTELKRMSA